MYGKEPMYMDVLEDLDINDDVRHLARQFTQLSEKDRELVKNMVDSLCEKIEQMCIRDRCCFSHRKRHFTGIDLQNRPLLF